MDKNRQWDKLTDTDLWELIEATQGADRDIKARIMNLTPVISELALKEAWNPKLQVHHRYNIIIEPEDLSSEATKKALPYLPDFKLRKRAATKRLFRSWLAQVVSSCYFDVLRSRISKRTPKNWKHRVELEITDGWLKATVKGRLAHRWKEIDQNNREVFKDYTHSLRAKNGQKLSLEEITRALCAKIKSDTLRHAPAVFLTSNYQFNSGGRKNPTLFLDDLFSAVDKRFINLVNGTIMPAIKSRIGKRVLMQKESLIHQRGSPEDDPEEVERPVVDEKSEIPMIGLESTEDLIAGMAETFEPHKTIIFIMTKAIGWGVDELIRTYSLYTLAELYNSFLESSKIAFSMTRA